MKPVTPRPQPSPRTRPAAKAPRRGANDGLAEQPETALRAALAAVFGPSPLLGQGNDIEVIHQMRVNTRRLRVGLQVYARLFDERELEQIERHLRRVGRTLGAVRAWDVNRQRLARLTDPRTEPAVGALDQDWAKQRAAAARAAREFFSQLQVSELEARVRHLLGCARYRSAEQLREDVGAELNALRQQARQRLKKYRDKHSRPAFHKLRIALKQYRYGLEWAAACFAMDAQASLAATARLQALMGRAHDYEVAEAAVEAFLEQHKTLAKPLRPMLKLIRKQQQRRARQVDKFLGQTRGWLKKVRLTAHT